MLPASKMRSDRDGHRQREQGGSGRLMCSRKKRLHHRQWGSVFEFVRQWNRPLRPCNRDQRHRDDPEDDLKRDEVNQGFPAPPGTLSDVRITLAGAQLRPDDDRQGCDKYGKKDMSAEECVAGGMPIARAEDELEDQGCDDPGAYARC